jgi:hypothetical protein
MGRNQLFATGKNRPGVASHVRLRNLGGSSIWIERLPEFRPLQ